ncbi:MAG: hypothetical protein FWH12_02725 [Treponema sp.]|nr:hypothetical protein [Treponema sp.]
MINTRLIMVEGLPTTGKTTNSDFLRMQLERNGKIVEWLHEDARPHPLMAMSQACMTNREYEDLIENNPELISMLNSAATFRKSTVGIDLFMLEKKNRDKIEAPVYEKILTFDSFRLTLDNYEKHMIEKWELFSDRANKNQDTIYIMDSILLQNQIWMFLLNNKPYEKLAKYVNKLCDAVKELNPVIINFYRANAESTIDFIEHNRGIQWLEHVGKRDKTKPYYQGKQEGAESFKQFLRDYAHMSMTLLHNIDCNSLPIEISKGNWTEYENSILHFLNIDNIASPVFLPPSGIFFNQEYDSKFIIDGLTIQYPDGRNRKLTPKTAQDFYVERLPIILRFDNPEHFTITGTQINEPWATIGTIYTKTT